MSEGTHIDAIADLCRIDLSYTRLKTFMDCRRKYKLVYLDGIKTEKTPQLILGSAAHHALEKYIADGCSTVEELTGHFLGYIQSQPFLGDEAEEYTATGVGMLNHWWKEHQEILPEHTYEVEKYFEVRLQQCLLRGYIDRMEVIGNRVEITDYKTGKSEMSEKALKKDLQLPIYAIAGREMYPDKEIFCSIHYLRSGHVRTVSFTDKELDAYIKRIDQWTTKIINEKKYDATWSGYLCRFCQLSPDYCNWPQRKQH